MKLCAVPRPAPREVSPRLVSDNYQRELRAKLNWLALKMSSRAPTIVKVGLRPGCPLGYTSFVGFGAGVPVPSAHEALEPKMPIISRNYLYSVQSRRMTQMTGGVTSFHTGEAKVQLLH